MLILRPLTSKDTPCKTKNDEIDTPFMTKPPKTIQLLPPAVCHFYVKVSSLAFVMNM